MQNVEARNEEVKAARTRGLVSGDDASVDEEEEKRVRSVLEGAVCTAKPCVRWDDVVGLENAKEALRDGLAHCLDWQSAASARGFPDGRLPRNSVLLYGPPGSGKTLLTQAAATEANSTVFIVSSSDLAAKCSAWQGDVKLLVMVLFAMLLEKSPAPVIFDDIDLLVTNRGGCSAEVVHAFATEFAAAISRVLNTNLGICVICTTCVPQLLDDALVGQMEHHVFIPLPGLTERAQLFRKHVGNALPTLSGLDFELLARRCEGFSPSDVILACHDAMMEPVRMCSNATHFIVVDMEGKDMYMPGQPNNEDAIEMDLTSVPTGGLQPPQLSLGHVRMALEKVKRSVSADVIAQYEEFARGKREDKGAYGEDNASESC